MIIKCFGSRICVRIRRMGVVPLWLGVTPFAVYGTPFADYVGLHPCGFGCPTLCGYRQGGFPPALFTLVQNKQHNQRQRRASKRKNAYKDMSQKFSHFEFILSIFSVWRGGVPAAWSRERIGRAERANRVDGVPVYIVEGNSLHPVHRDFDCSFF